MSKLWRAACAVLWFCFLAVFFSSALAQDGGRTDLAKLALDPGWLKLGHYEPDSDSPTGWRSAIHDDFFLDRNGQTDPLAELNATIVGFSAPQIGDSNQHALCRFPARRLWLIAKLADYPALSDRISCPMFDAWTRLGTVSSVSIVFATGYLGNPASYYGHTLLKLNFKGDKSQTRLMDVSVNFGAIVDKNDDPVTYIVKSVAGGYDAGFSHINFYFHNHNYGDNELRDMWEYELNLPREAVDLIVSHAWEVLGKRYTYGFFRQNCAYRMAEIFEVVDGLTIIPERSPWIVPQQLIEELGVARYHGEPVLLDVNYIPSRQSRFYEKYLSLSPQEANLLGELAEGRQSLDDRVFQERATGSKQALLDSLLDYYQFVGNPLDKAPLKTREKYAKVLSKRYELPPGVPEIKHLLPKSPHLARELGWVQTAWIHNTVTGDAFSYIIRPAYYDVLDADSGHVRNASLVMGELQLKVSHGHVQVEKIDLIGVDSANPGLTGIAGDTRTAWKLHTGAEQARLSCEKCLVVRIQGDYGYGRQWSEKLFTAIYVGGAVQSKWAEQGVGFARTSVNLIMRDNDQLGVRVAYEQRFPIGGSQRNYGVSSAEARWKLNTKTDFRLSFVRDKAQQVGLGFGLYW